MPCRSNQLPIFECDGEVEEVDMLLLKDYEAHHLGSLVIILEQTI